VNPGLRSLARGERSICGWDEDAITIAVEAARGCLGSSDRSRIGRVYFGSTTAPYADRLNVGVVAGALGLDERISAFDLGGSLRAGTSALLAALDAAAVHDDGVLCVAADRRNAAAATQQELVIGHAAAALLVGRGAGVARLVGRSSLTVDFVDHFRAADREFDYHWEERWVRDEGHGIRADDMERIFERFGRAASGRGIEGSGLGLPIVAAIATAHAGRVEVESAEGCGSTFTLVLPRKEPVA